MTQSVGKVMQAAGKRWRDPTLDEWPENDHRIFVGDLGKGSWASSGDGLGCGSGALSHVL